MGIEGVPDTMLAVQVMEYGKPLAIHKIAAPTSLGPYDLLIKVAAAGLCHTDFMVQNGDFPGPLPRTASHEGAGTVVATGSSVSSFKKGDRVMVGIGLHPCGTCADCQGPENYKQYCINKEGSVGVTMDGNFAEYVVCDARISAKIPDSVSFEAAAPLACAGSTVYRAVAQARLKAGEWLAIVGAGGGLGHLGVQFAKARGLNVIAVDARDEGLALAKESGADVVVDARKGDNEVVKEVGAVTNGAGADATVNVSDASPAAGTACKVTKMHGRMVQIAQPEYVSVPFKEIIFRDIRIEGSVICSPQESWDMLETVAKHGIKVKMNPVVGLEKVPELIELAESGKMAGKGIVIVDEEQVKKQKEGEKVVV